MNYVEHESPKIIEKHYANDYKNIIEILSSQYPYIMESIKKEEYLIEYDDFSYFREIIYDGKVVGFITFSLPDNPFYGFLGNNNLLTIDECYILPEFRGNNILCELLVDLLNDQSYIFHVRRPNRNFIAVLLKNNLAFKVSDNIVISCFSLSVSSDEGYKNPKIKKFYKTSNKVAVYSSNLFNIDLCSTMFLDDKRFYVKSDNIFALTNPRNSDIKRYNCCRKLEGVDETYLLELRETVSDNDREIRLFLEKCKNSLEESLRIENVLGSSDNFTDSFKNLLKENNLTHDDGVKIYNHISQRVDDGLIDPKSIKLRLNYLLKNMDEIDFDEDVGTVFEECAYCGRIPRYNYIKVCRSCGHVVNKDDGRKFGGFLSMNHQDDLNKSHKDYEVRKFYDDCLIEFSYHEFYKYYKKYSPEHSLEEISEIFAEDKLNDAIADGDSFYMYCDYLLYKMYFHLHYGNPRDSAIAVIQYLILSSNRAFDNAKNIVEDNPTSGNAFEFMYVLDETDFKYDESCCDEAYATFKLPEYANNKKEIYESMPKYFIY